MEHAPYRVAQELELLLGDPEDPDEVFSHARCLELDEREEFPAEICRVLERWGLPEYYIPAEHGGRLTDYETVLQVMRVVARRDLTVAVGHGKTYLGGVCVWVSGTPEQARALATDIRAAVPVSLALTERAHGSDLIAGDVHGEPDGTAGWRLTGEKWLINNATRGSLLSVLTRTSSTGGPRGFTVFLVDKRRLAAGEYRCVDKIRTHGIRGADISGIVFDGAPVAADAAVGAVGGGLETVLKALQLTRTMCASLSLGAADHALRIAWDFTERRELYGRRLVELPQARHVLAGAATDVLIGEALATVAARSVHTVTDELSVCAAVTKYLIPTGTEAVIAQLTKLLGARAFLKDVHARGMFQKIDRDHRIVGLFDGNTLVNLNSLVNQFRSLVRGWQRGTGDTAGATAAFDLSRTLPALDPKRLSLVARRGSGIMASLPDSVALLRAEAAERPELQEALTSAGRLLKVVEQVHQVMDEHRAVVSDVPPEAFDVARRYSLCLAGAACLGLWVHNQRVAGQGPTGGLWRDGVWLRAALDRLLERLGEPTAGEPEAYPRLLEELRTAQSSGALFSLFALRLPHGEAASVSSPTPVDAHSPTAQPSGHSAKPPPGRATGPVGASAPARPSELRELARSTVAPSASPGTSAPGSKGTGPYIGLAATDTGFTPDTRSSEGTSC